MLRPPGRPILFAALAVMAAAVWLFAAACGDDNGYNADELILATTTSLNDSGLLDELAPIFEDEQDVTLKIIAVGTGAALRMAAEGNADAVLAHAPDAERELVANRDVTARTLVAYNDFVIVGPPDDPAGVRGLTDAAAALAQIAAQEAPFASRGDDSGTHKKELALWDDAGIEPSGDWYLEVGQGMSASLTVADQRGAYILSDRGTFLAISHSLTQLEPILEGDPRLLNFYSVLEVNGDKGRINTVAAAAFAQFLTRDDIQQRIGDFRREEYGRPLFNPAAGQTEASIAARGG